MTCCVAQEDQPATLVVLPNDSDFEGKTLTLCEVSPALYDQAEFLHDRTLAYTPPTDFVRLDYVGYIVT